ncbi:hypothetical protein [Jeotgalibacillus haloalkalitolerans]|uniref:DUF2953 domain-containing protein n=1 Tax=Jeotgalibacillus haloalkalitolerans TaxID=3104292 RepID=A0ABU5KML1_9BACL|nr:hypothetical protein [Jeotgalibacillus sp. HH7-29]MDZ5712474.1 hypothetical protein [Jeotgalibacillus sp. HH7-29]
MIKLLFLLFLPLLLMLKCKCMIEAEWKGKSIHLLIVIKIAGIKIKRFTIPIELLPEPEYQFNRKPKKLTRSDLRKLKKKLDELRRNIFRLNRWLKATLKGFRIDQLNMSAGIGVDSPDISAWLNGGIGIVQAILVQQLAKYFTLTAAPHISIRPGYVKSPFTAVCHCIISVSIAHLMKAGVILLYRRVTNQHKRVGSDLIGTSN